jgi:hypothetical protein
MSHQIEMDNVAQRRVQPQNPKPVDWNEQRCSYWPMCCKNNITSCQVASFIIILVGLLLVLIFVPLGFSYVEYDQYALKKDKFSNQVEAQTTYEVGRYWWGVDKTPLAFNRRFIQVTEDFAIFPSSGLEFEIEIVFFYRIRKDRLGELFKSFGIDFHGQVVNRASATIKNAAPAFDLEEFITARSLISEALYASLIEELSAIWIDVPADRFFLSEIKIPEEVKQRNLDAAVQQQRNFEEQNRQQATLVRKETEQREQQINANISLIGSTATATANRIRTEAQAVTDKVISSADGLGLQSVFNQLNVTDTRIKEKYISYFAFLDSFLA